MTVAFLTSDLVFPSRVAGVASRIGAVQLTAATIDLLIAKLAGASTPIIAILDLNSPTVDPAAVVPRLKTLPIPPQSIIAFGPHVHEAKLQAAQIAGCNLVLARGQFDAQMGRLITELLTGSASQSES